MLACQFLSFEFGFLLEPGELQARQPGETSKPCAALAMAQEHDLSAFKGFLLKPSNWRITTSWLVSLHSHPASKPSEGPRLLHYQNLAVGAREGGLGPVAFEGGPVDSLRRCASHASKSM